MKKVEYDKLKKLYKKLKPYTEMEKKKMIEFHD